MSIDYSAILFDPVYNALGVPATLTTLTDEIVFQQNVFQSNVFSGGLMTTVITVIDDTRAKTNVSGALEVRSIGPGAFARVPELTEKGADRAYYDGSILAFNGRTWIVRSHELRGSPNGEDSGEVHFLLKSQP